MRPALLLTLLLCAQLIAQEKVVSPEVAARHLKRGLASDRTYALVYPPFAKAARIEGVVRVRAQVSADGKVHSAQAISGPVVFFESARDAVMRYVFKPFTENRKPIIVETTVEVFFKLPPGEARSYPPPSLAMKRFSLIKEESTHPLSPRMQKWLADDLSQAAESCKEMSSIEDIQAATTVQEIPGAPDGTSSYLVSRRGRCLCGATGNCSAKFVEDTPHGVRLVIEESLWGVALEPREGSPYPDTFLAQHMGAFQQDIYGFAYIGGEWGQLYCGSILFDQADSHEINEVHQCR
jgi:TonB family protein